MREWDRDSIGSLRVMVGESLVTQGSNGEDRDHGEFRTWTEITDGRPGGFSHDHDL